MKIETVRRKVSAVVSTIALGLGLTVAATTATVLSSPGLAHAVTDTATITPVTGTSKSIMSMHTSAQCPATADSYQITVQGPSLPIETIVNGLAPLDNAGGFAPGAAAGLDAPISNIWDIVRSNAGVSSINPGDYTWRFLCRDGFANATVATYFATQTVTAAMTPQAPGAWTMPTGGGGTGVSAAVSASPATSAAPGATVTFTATIAPATPGSVQFMDGTANLGSAVAVTATNTVATATSSTLAAGAHAIKAVFTPTDPTKPPVTSSVLTYTITTSTLTTTNVQASPQSPALPGGTFTFTANVTPSTAVGSVLFTDGTTTLATVQVANGAAAFATTTLAVGIHNIVAVFTPTDPTQFTSSQSAPLPYTVSTAQVTVTTLVLAPVGAAAPGDTVVLTATVQPTTAVGSIQFKDGNSVLGVPVPVTNGIATNATSTMSIGTHSVTAVFYPTVATTFATSTSLPQFYFIGTGARTTTVVSTDPPGPVPPRTAVTVTAQVSPSSAVGKVEFFDGTTSLGIVPLSNGTANYTAQVLVVGTHPLSAVFTPTDPAAYKGSATTIALAFVVAVDAPPVFTTPSKVNGNPIATGSVTCDASMTGADLVASPPTFVWIVDGIPVVGATDHVFQIPMSYYGRLLQCQLVVSNARGTTRSPIGAAVLVGAVGRLTVTIRPALSGAFVTKHRVHVSPGSWSADDVIVTFQWVRDGRAIKGARGMSYRLGKNDRRHRVTCVVTAKLFGYSGSSVAPTARRVA